VFVSKINNTSFKGYQHSINNGGEHTYKFSYPYDESAQNVKIEFYKEWAKEGDIPVKVIDLKEVNTINFNDIPELSKTSMIPYRILLDGKHVVDSGFYTGDRAAANGFNLINRNATAPTVQGQAILTMVDTHRPGAFYNDFNSNKTGSIEYDIEKQRASENIVRTFSNRGGGTLAGVEYDLDSLKNMGVKKIFMTPLWGGDNVSGHHYWNKNDNQLAESVGNVENYTTFIRKLFKNGMQYVDDIAITSEGLEGIHVQYALRWANQEPQTKYWFRMNGLQNGPIGLGIVPKNKQNLRHRVINPSVIYNSTSQKIEKNPNYNPHKETYFQIYDASQVSDEQLSNTDVLISEYKNTFSDNKISIKNSEETIVPYAFEIKPDEYKNRLEELVKINRNSDKKIELNSPEGTLFIGQFTNFKIGNDAEGAVFWDANKDIFKRNYYISGYDEKLINAFSNQTERDNIRERIKRANYEVQDIAIQAGLYRTQLVKDTQILYTAQTLQNSVTKEDIDKLIGNGLPQEAQLDSETISNILGGWYNLEQKNIDTFDNITLKSLMKLPLDSLEVGDNTSGVLATSFFTNRATDNDTVGLSRFEYYKKNLGVYHPYNLTYYNTDNLFETKLKNFAFEVISLVNKNSKEKLLDDKGNYTEYGEYVIDLLGRDITKYAFLKALAGKNFEAKIMPDDVNKGKLTYNYPKIKEKTTLKALGINATSPEEEARELYRVISDGLSDLDRKDVDIVAESILKQTEGTTLNSFRLAEAIVGKASLGLDFRLDAAKDVVDMDAVRNGDMSFDEAWDQAIDFWKKYVKTIKNINPNAYIVAEITDLDKLMQEIYGHNTDPYGSDFSQAGGKYKNVPDALRAFFNETGITSEAGYSYTFTNLLHLFSADAEYGDIRKNGISGIEERMQTLINTNGIDYIKNLWTFADNHDKPSILHAMALDMELFHTNNLMPEYRNSAEEYKTADYETRRRNSRISVLQEYTNADRFEDLPLEAMMNIDNGEYFKAVSTRSTAMSKLMRSALNDRIPDSFNKKAILKQALVDLTNGNYLSDNNNINFLTINIPALRTLEAALDEILSAAGITLSEKDKKAIISRAKQRDMIEKYAVRGDFDWGGGKDWVAVELQNRAKSVLANSEYEYMKYSPYTVSVAALLLDSYSETIKNKDIEKFTNGTRNFVHKYTRMTVNESKTLLPYTNDSQTAQNTKAYASRDIETVIEMIIQQAEYKSGQKFTKSEHDYIMKELFESSTEPAVQKALMYSAFLSALPGIPSVYYRDILGGLGYDEKAKNIFLQNRNTVKYSQIESDGPLKEYRTKIFKEFQEVMKIRNTKGLQAINNGTPYLLKTNHSDVLAMLYKNSDETAITIINAGGINPKNRVEYDEKISKDSANEINTINNKNKYVPKQERVELNEIIVPATLGVAAGTVFISALGNDWIEYIVKKAEDGTSRLVRKDGKKIILDGKNTKLGALFLKIFKRPSFKGRNTNVQYNFAPYQYQRFDKEPDLGQNLICNV